MKFNVFAGVLFATALGVIFLYAPEEAEQGMVQKIFYIHVASAITSYIGFFIAFLTGLLYLLEKKPLYDELTVAAIESSFFFCTMVLLTGPIWARPIWGVWWTWEPRLTVTFLLWLLYAGYLVVRGYFGPTPRGRTISSVIAVIAALDIPLVHFSVRLWRGVHPSVVSSAGEGITFKMKMTLLITFLALAILLFAYMRVRFMLERRRNDLTALRLKHAEGV